MKFWFLTNTARLGAERRAVEALAARETWFELERWRIYEGNFCADGVIQAHAQRYPIRLQYPDQFPEVPAWVEPREEARWSTHQYGSGTLCLQLRPDNWTPIATGADLLRSAYDLLITEDPLGDGGQRAPSAHRVGEIQAYAWDANPLLISAGCRERVLNGASVDLKALRWLAADDVWPIVVHDEMDRQRPQRPPESDAASWRFEASVFVSREVATTLPSDRSAFLERAGFDQETAERLANLPAVVLFAGGDELTAYNLLAEGEPHRRRVFVLPDEVGQRSARAPDAGAKRIAIVGAGSVGSKIAVSLARSGVCRFVIADGDVLLPGNLERHELDWRDVGFRKVHGLKRRLLGVAPGADVTVIDQNLNWQRSARTHAWQTAELAQCDLIVDATGDAATSLFLGAVADANGRAFVSVEVFEGGIGGLVALALPRRDPAFAEGRAAFLAWCDAQGVKAPEAGPRPYEMLAEDGTPVVADDAAVTMTAGHAARVVLDVIDGCPPPIESAWLLLGYRKAWLFEGHGHTIRLSVGERRGVAAAEVDEDARSLAMHCLEEWLSENKSAG